MAAGWGGGGVTGCTEPNFAPAHNSVTSICAGYSICIYVSAYMAIYQ